MKFNRIGFISLLFVVITVLMIGCSSNNDQNESEGPSDNFNKEGFPIVDDSISLTMFGADNSLQDDWEDMSLFKYMEDKTNIKFDFDTTATSDIDDKRNLILSSGDYPDVIMNAQMSPQEEAKYGDSGILIPLEDLIEKYAPNLNKILEENPEYEAQITSPDGHIYSLPVIKDSPRAQLTTRWLNGKWLDELDVDEAPETTDELYELLKRFKDEDPNGNGENDEIPVTVLNAPEDLRTIFLSDFGISAEAGNPDEGEDGIYVDDQDEVQLAMVQDNYKKYLEFMNKLWDEELLDHDIFSQEDDVYQGKGADEKVGLFLEQTPEAFLTDQSDEELKNNKLLQPLTSPVSDEQMTKGDTVVERGAFSITDKNEHTEASIRWADHMYDEDVSMMVYTGAESEEWDWVDDDESEFEVNVPDEKIRDEIRGEGSPSVGVENVPSYQRYEDDGFLSKKADEIETFADEEADEKAIPYKEVPIPNVYFEPDETDKLTTLTSDTNEYIEQNEAEFITGKKSFDEWDEYVNELKEMGGDELVDIYQDAYDRFLKAEEEVE